MSIIPVRGLISDPAGFFASGLEAAFLESVVIGFDTFACGFEFLSAGNGLGFGVFLRAAFDACLNPIFICPFERDGLAGVSVEVNVIATDPFEAEGDNENWG